MKSRYITHPNEKYWPWIFAPDTPYTTIGYPFLIISLCYIFQSIWWKFDKQAYFDIPLWMTRRLSILKKRNGCIRIWCIHFTPISETKKPWPIINSEIVLVIRTIMFWIGPSNRLFLIVSKRWHLRAFYWIRALTKALTYYYINRSQRSAVFWQLIRSPYTPLRFGTMRVKMKMWNGQNIPRSCFTVLSWK